MKSRFSLIGLAALVAMAMAPSVRAQRLFPDQLAPGFRGTTGSDYAKWDRFSWATDPALNPNYDPDFPEDGPEYLPGYNYGDVVAGASSPYITQTLAPSAFITSGFNIYSFSEATGFNVVNNVAPTLGTANNVVFQFDTLGTFIDYSSIRLNYTGSSGSGSIAATNVMSESRLYSGGMGGFTNRGAFQWDLTNLGVTSFTITFRSLGSSNSFNVATLDVSNNPFVEVVASARTWDGEAADGKWGSAANWSNNSLTSVGGNVTFGASTGASVEIDTTTREVGQLNISKTGAFTLSASGGAMLRVNTGISATGGSGSNVVISAPVFMGGHNFMNVAANTTLTLSGNITAAGAIGTTHPSAGLYKQGAGTLILSGTNTFNGALTLDGGTMIISGTNSYINATTISEGTMVLQGHAPNGSVGTLGRGTSNIAFSYDPGAGPTSTAAIIIDGNYTVARHIDPAAGDNTKVLGARNATTGATFSGNIAFAETTNNVILRAENAGDIVNFTGEISGGSPGLQVTKDGAGTVVYGGVAKTYFNATTVAAGTLQVESGASMSTGGNVNVSSGAQLIVNGTLNGTGSLNVNGGTIGGSGRIERAFTLDTGDVLSPGNSPGTLTTVNQTWAGGATLKLEINDADAGMGTGWDHVDIEGTLSLTASSSSKFKLELTSLTSMNASGLIADFNPNADYTWKFLTSTNDISGFDAGKFQIDTSHFQNPINGAFSVIMGADNKSLSVQYLAVPEPSSSILALSGALALLHRRRRPTKQS